jgi:hypothetical protein
MGATRAAEGRHHGGHRPVETFVCCQNRRRRGLRGAGARSRRCGGMLGGRRGVRIGAEECATVSLHMSASSYKDVNLLTRRHNRRVIVEINGQVKRRGWARRGCRGWALHPHIYGPASSEGRRMNSLWNPPTQTWRTRLIVRIRTRPLRTVSAALHVDGGRASPTRRLAPSSGERRRYLSMNWAYRALRPAQLPPTQAFLLSAGRT